MTNALPGPRHLVRHIKTVMSREPRKRGLQHDLASPLRPTAAFLGLFQYLQLTANIDEHAGELLSHCCKRTRHSLLCGDDLAPSSIARTTLIAARLL